ncbi:MAG: hypothetical protein Kow00107_05830 [Planctomycetota bacterium]
MRALLLLAALVLAVCCFRTSLAEQVLSEEEIAEALESLDEILERDEFIDPKERKEEISMLETSFLEEIAEDINDWFKGLKRRIERLLRSDDKPKKPQGESFFDFNLLSGKGMLKVLVIAIITAIAAAIIWVIVLLFKGGGRKDLKSEIGPLGGEDALAHSPEEWSGIAEDRISSGNLRGALRALYLSLLSQLHDSRKIVYVREKTNWEYVRSMPDGEPVKQEFRELTATFDRVWYGLVEPDKDTYESFKAVVKEALSKLK